MLVVIVNVVLSQPNLLANGLHFSQLKFSSVMLAKQYMNRIAKELECVSPQEDDLLLQGVRFAYRVHQVSNFVK